MTNQRSERVGTVTGRSTAYARSSERRSDPPVSARTRTASVVPA
jgi:hypothetical protein